MHAACRALASETGTCLHFAPHTAPTPHSGCCPHRVLASIARYAICHQPLPAGGLGSEHAAAEWTATGVFCGTTGLFNWLLVEVWTSLGPVAIMLFVAGERGVVGVARGWWG